MTRPGKALRSDSSIDLEGEESLSYCRLIWLAPASCIRNENRSKTTNVVVIHLGKHHNVLKLSAYVGQENQTTREKAV